MIRLRSRRADISPLFWNNFQPVSMACRNNHALQLSTRGLCAIQACAIRAHNSPLEVFARELNRVRESEPCLLEGMQ